jgi:hypothetical protein
MLKAFRLVILALLASTSKLAYCIRYYFEFEMELVPKWLSLKEKHPHPNAACAAATIR